MDVLRTPLKPLSAVLTWQLSKATLVWPPNCKAILLFTSLADRYVIQT
jgi:hypothetical protein